MWILVIIGIGLGYVVSPKTFELVELLTMGTFDRSGLDQLVLEFIGEQTWNNILVDDLLVNTYLVN